MAHDALVLAAHPDAKLQELQPPMQEAPAPPTPEQVRAADAVFAQQQPENSAAAAVVGLYTGFLMLHNLAAETFYRAEEFELKPRLKADEKDEAAEDD